MNTSYTPTFFLARTALDDGTLGPPEQYVLVYGAPIMTMVEYHQWLTSQAFKNAPGRPFVRVH
jgi:hypothetical protein